ncbi:MAG: PEP/pyruvate-binding domain-containing protein, partial [Paracoccaceae bacterium]
MQTACIAPLHVFSLGSWQIDRKSCLVGLKEKVGSDLWIVRSSCLREDSIDSSNAGAFLSVLNVDSAGLEKAIERVFAAYGEADISDEVLIQPMLTHVVRSGVAFSHDPNTCAPYRVVNWTDGSDTAEVTGGLGGRVWQQAA